MSLEAWLLSKIVEKVFSYALDKGQGAVERWVRDRLGLEPRKQAFKRALDKAYRKFEKKYPEWAADLFNASFLENESALDYRIWVEKFIRFRCPCEGLAIDADLHTLLLY